MCGVGYGILQVEDLEDVAAVDRHKNGLWQMRAQLVFDLVGFVLEGEYLITDFANFPVVTGAQGIEKSGHQVSALHDHPHVLLQRPKGRLAEQL